MEAYLVYVSFGLGLLSMLLHFIAPRTKSTLDDKLVGPVDAAKDFVDGLQPKDPPSPQA